MAGGGSQQSRSSNEPWRGAQPYLSSLYGRAEDFSNQPLDYYGGDLTAPRSAETTASLERMQGLGLSGSPMLDSAYNTTNQTLRGDFLDPSSNPYLNSTFNTAAEGVSRHFNRTVMPNLESRFAGSGRTGSPAYQSALGESGRMLAGELGGLANQVYGGNYQQERGRQMQASQFAPQLDYGTRFAPLQAGAQAGVQSENYAQSVIDALQQQHDFLRDEPSLRQSRLAQILGTSVPTQGSSSASGWNMSLLGG